MATASLLVSVLMTVTRPVEAESMCASWKPTSSELREGMSLKMVDTSSSMDDRQSASVAEWSNGRMMTCVYALVATFISPSISSSAMPAT